MVSPLTFLLFRPGTRSVLIDVLENRVEVRLATGPWLQVAHDVEIARGQRQTVGPRPELSNLPHEGQNQPFQPALDERLDDTLLHGGGVGANLGHGVTN